MYIVRYIDKYGKEKIENISETELKIIEIRNNITKINLKEARKDIREILSIEKGNLCTEWQTYSHNNKYSRIAKSMRWF